MASITNPILWIHGDNLHPNSPVWQTYPAAPAIWVWDDAYLRRAGFSLKRILFLYECLLALPVDIYRGDVVAELTAFAQRHASRDIVTMGSPSPGFARYCDRLRTADFTLHIYDEEPFVMLPPNPDLRRFSRYWRVAQAGLKAQ